MLLDSPLVIFPSSVHLNIFKHLSTLIYGKYRLPDQLIFLGITSSINGYIKIIYSNDIDKYIHNLHTQDCAYINALICFREYLSFYLLLNIAVGSLLILLLSLFLSNISYYSSKWLVSCWSSSS